jgi:hypothetical protein
VRCPSCGHTFTAPASEDERTAFDDPPPLARPARPTYAGYGDDLPAPRLGEKPGKVLAIAIMTLVGGIFATILGAAYMASCFLMVWPGTYYSLVAGILAIVKGANLLGEQAHEQPPPQGIAIMQIVNIVNGDVVNLVLGIVTLVFLNEPEVRRFFRGRRA